MKFESKFVGEIAYFRCRGAKIVGFKEEESPSSRTTVLFILELEWSESHLEQERNKYLNRFCSVEPRSFADMIKDTTDLLFNELRKKGKYHGKK